MEPEYGSSQEKGQLNLRKVSMLTPLTLVLLRALAAVEGVEGSVFPSCLRAIEVTLSFSPVQLSHLMASQGVALAFSGPLWASFVDNGFSRRLLLASSLLMSTVLGAIMSGASHFPTFLILRIWNGVALSTRRPVVQAVVSEEVPAKRHGWEFGVLNFSAMFGGLPAGVFFYCNFQHNGSWYAWVAVQFFGRGYFNPAHGIADAVFHARAPQKSSRYWFLH